jgi:hypothetical protein
VIDVIQRAPKPGQGQKQQGLFGSTEQVLSQPLPGEVKAVSDAARRAHLRRRYQEILDAAAKRGMKLKPAGQRKLRQRINELREEIRRKYGTQQAVDPGTAMAYTSLGMLRGIFGLVEGGVEAQATAVGTAWEMGAPETLQHLSSAFVRGMKRVGQAIDPAGAVLGGQREGTPAEDIRAFYDQVREGAHRMDTEPQRRLDYLRQSMGATRGRPFEPPQHQWSEQEARNLQAVTGAMTRGAQREQYESRRPGMSEQRRVADLQRQLENARRSAVMARDAGRRAHFEDEARRIRRMLERTTWRDR